MDSIKSVFGLKDVRITSTAIRNCPLCKEGKKLDALINCMDIQSCKII